MYINDFAECLTHNRILNVSSSSYLHGTSQSCQQHLSRPLLKCGHAHLSGMQDDLRLRRRCLYVVQGKNYRAFTQQYSLFSLSDIKFDHNFLGYLKHNVPSVSDVQHSDSTSLQIMLCSPQVWLPSVTIQCYYNIIDYVSYAVSFIPMIQSFHNWKSVPPTPLYPFCPCLHASFPLATINLFSVFIDMVLLLFVYSVVLSFRFHI